ncbi:MAG: 2-amino-4-hydroxy-6-hydroxymethyldihydropteridine diphosphokinase [Candidatus Aquicultor primus]|uniref:2-amino-4-hydroxy-6-hydroxymethyldihydropteridine diphosphokinase n=1 Tax=Candidatus Aquicultor primus TaxID=1797195 RepID=A0A1F2UL04_9ACTN|nr:MAG: 2-amino-4-hydroxy-6-hydroxymethyldihydropteridine diphosphokinase [Candidatus Aquicultor primus]
MEAYLSLGSNLGDRRRNLKEALRMIGETDCVSVEKISPLYETGAVGGVEQGDFYNVVARIETSLSPRELLHLAHRVEKRLDRVHGERWGPRTIDVDILLYGEASIDEKDLVVPHPEMENRAFVLAPLGDIAPLLMLPSGRTVSERLAGIEGQTVKIIGSLD